MLSISLIIISYNSEKFIDSCLKSIKELSLSFNKVIVIDNNSNDNSVKIISKNKNVECIKLNYNSGYSKAANIGIKAIKSDLCVIANADILFDKYFVENTVKYFINNSRIDMMSPLMLRFDKETIDSAGQEYSLALYPKETGYNKKKKKELKKKKIFSVCGALTVFRCSSLEKLCINGEYYDEDFFMFWEDFDIGWRANLLNMNIVFYPESVIYHFRSGTLKRNLLSKIALSLGREPEIKFHLIKNRYLTLIKNFYFRKFWYLIPFIIIKDILWVGMLTLSSPKIIIKLMMSLHMIKSAYIKRNLLKKSLKEISFKK